MRDTKRRMTPNQSPKDLSSDTSTKVKKPRKRRTNPDRLLSGMERHNLKLVELASKDISVVRLSTFNLDEFCARVLRGDAPMSERKPQPGLKPLRLQKVDGPRIVVDQKDNFLMFYAPDFWGTNTQKYLLDTIHTLDALSPLQEDASRANTDKRAISGSAEGSRRAEWGLHHHGLGQQFKYALRPSPALRVVGGTKGVQGRQQYLTARTINDGKINHMTRIIHETFHTALMRAKTRVQAVSPEGADWATKWGSSYLNQAIFENRQTGLHRDSRGSAYCAEFLSILGDFEGGDLSLPDLNMSLEWLPNAACMFDGRTFAHEVMPWKGARRLCLVNYIWKTSMDDLGIELPKKAPTLSEIVSRVQSEQAARTVSSKFVSQET